MEEESIKSTGKVDLFNYVEEVKRLLKTITRPGADKLLAWIEDESDYYTSPGSSKYHSNYSGGLVEHSYHVYTLFKEKNDRFKLGLSEETMIIVGLLHDVCKVNTYTLNVLKNGYISDYAPYKKEDKFNVGHSEKSIIMIQRFIQLSDEEVVIIRMHMGPFDYNWKWLDGDLNKTFRSYVAFHTADFEASRYLDSTRDQKMLKTGVAEVKSTVKSTKPVDSVEIAKSVVETNAQ